MRIKVLGVVALCAVLLTGCSNSSTSPIETSSSASVQQETEISPEFKLATNYQEGGEYYKA